MAQAADGWSPAASMSTARYGHAATVLANGRVLVTGGSNASGIVASAQLYDPVSATWSVAGSMHEARAHHTATLLKSGKVLVTGVDLNQGSATEYAGTAELYDPARNTWSPAASMSAIRSGHTATLLGNGKVLVTGGSGSFDLDLGHGFSSSAELYDPVRNTWSPTAGMSRARVGLTATLLASGKVLVAGGNDDFEGDRASAELYNPVSATWSPAARMSTARTHHAATRLANGKVLVTGGLDDPSVMATAELYDPVSDTWSAAGSMSNSRFDHTATLLSSGKVLVTGGLRVNGNIVDSDVIANSEQYDPRATPGRRRRA
ncbi:MAG TPA: kelch repeat-containing protein [Solirubrobacteraceae bacterium]|nr:kelch repeat-containing protein [Solirubrobacteraceae bacterium]